MDLDFLQNYDQDYPGPVINLVREHNELHGSLIVKFSGKFYLISYENYAAIADGRRPFISVKIEERFESFFIEDFNKTWWLIDSVESQRLKTLGKEENIMSKPDVIVGIVAMPTKKVEATKVVADYIRKRVTVLFSDGGKEVVDCHAEDEFDVVIGYSIAVTRHMAGSSGAVRRDINSVLLEIKPKIKKVKMGPIAPGQEPVKKPATKKHAKKSPAKKK